MSDDLSNADSHVPRIKDSILEEIFTVYAEAGKLYKITTDSKIHDEMLFIKHGCDYAIARLLPLNERFEKLLEEMRERFLD